VTGDLSHNPSGFNFQSKNNFHLGLVVLLSGRWPKCAGRIDWWVGTGQIEIVTFYPSIVYYHRKPAPRITVECGLTDIYDIRLFIIKAAVVSMLANNTS
jgi:hypothetical protein